MTEEATIINSPTSVVAGPCVAKTVDENTTDTTLTTTTSTDTSTRNSNGISNLLSAAMLNQESSSNKGGDTKSTITKSSNAMKDNSLKSILKNSDPFMQIPALNRPWHPISTSKDSTRSFHPSAMNIDDRYFPTHKTSTTSQTYLSTRNGSISVLTPGASTKQQEIEEFWQNARQQAIATVTSETASLTTSTTDDDEVDFMKDDEEIVKGITVRPSGTWQAQIYFAGKTRYIGVFESKIMAAKVFQVLRDLLRKKKSTSKQAQQNTIQSKDNTRQRTTEQAKRIAVPKVKSDYIDTTNISSQADESSSLPPLKKRRITSIDTESKDRTSDIKKTVGVSSSAANSNGCINNVQRNDNFYQSNHSFQYAENGHFYLNPIVPNYPYAMYQYSMYAPPGYLINPMPPTTAFYPPVPQAGFHQPPAGHQADNVCNHCDICGAPNPHKHHDIRRQPRRHEQCIRATREKSQPTKPKPQTEAVKKIKTSHKAEDMPCKNNTSKESSGSNKKIENEKQWQLVRHKVMKQFNGKQNTSSIFTKQEASSLLKNQEILRGITLRPSGKYQAQLYFAGKSRYIGVFESRVDAAMAYELIRRTLRDGPGIVPASKTQTDGGASAPPHEPRTAESKERAKQIDALLSKPVSSSELTISKLLDVINTRAITPSPPTVAGPYGKRSSSKTLNANAADSISQSISASSLIDEDDDIVI